MASTSTWYMNAYLYRQYNIFTTEMFDSVNQGTHIERPAVMHESTGAPNHCSTMQFGYFSLILSASLHTVISDVEHSIFYNGLAIGYKSTDSTQQGIISALLCY